MDSTIECADARSLMKFNGNQLRQLDLTIFNQSIQYIIHFLLEMNDNIFDDESSYEILANEFNWGLVIIGQINIEIDELKQVPSKLNYLQINSETLIDGKITDWYNIKKDYKTFTQRDDNIRKNIHAIIIEETSNADDNILFIGGEMYAYGKIANYEEGMAITDFEGIKNDTELNNQPNLKVKLVNYFNLKLNDVLDNFMPDTCIINLLHGLGPHLARQLNELYNNNILKKIIIVSCKPKEFEKDKHHLIMKTIRTKTIKTQSQALKIIIIE